MLRTYVQPTETRNLVSFYIFFDSIAYKSYYTGIVYETAYFASIKMIKKKKKTGIIIDETFFLASQP